MKKIVLDEVVVCYDKNLLEEWIYKILIEEKNKMAERNKKLGYLEIIKISENEALVTAKTKADIKRLRRITGYLSNIDNFNLSKKKELQDRVTHEL